jgi:transcriptional regulator with XRE-family HTH domain
LGEQLRIRRKAAGLTQEKLAEMADLNRNYVGEVERGEKTISVDALVRLAVAVKVRVRDLVHEL